MKKMLTKDSKAGNELVKTLRKRYPFLSKNDLFGIYVFAYDDDGANKILKYMEDSPTIGYKYVIGYAMHISKERKQSSSQKLHLL